MDKLLRFPQAAAPVMTSGDDACLEAFVRDLRARECDSKTIESYQSDVKTFRKDVGKELLEVEADDVYRIIERWQSQDITAATVQRRAASLRQFYNLLYMIGLISTRPTAELRVPKARRRMDVHPAEDLERVILAIGTQAPLDIRDRAVLLLLRDSGIRANAIAQCELANVDWKLGRIMLRKDKYAKDHWAPLSERSTAALRLYAGTVRSRFLLGRDLPYLFVSPKTNRPLTRQRIWQIANHWSLKVLGVRCSPHSWRRTILTEGADRGMELFDLMQMAGHAGPSTTQRYLLHSNSKLREVFRSSHPRAEKEKK
jgi:site-specific recombinase XerD